MPQSISKETEASCGLILFSFFYQNQKPYSPLNQNIEPFQPLLEFIVLSLLFFNPPAR